MSIKNSRLIESIFSLSILNVLNMLLPLITLPYIIKVVGMANFGAYSIVYAVIQYVLLVSTYGFSFSATKQIAQNKENLVYINRLFNATIVAKLFLAIVAFLLFYGITLLFFPHSYSQMLLLGLGVIIGDLLNPVWLFQGMEKMRYMTLINLICKLLFTVLIFVFISEKEDYIYITLLNSAGFMFAGIISICIACKVFHLRLFLPSFSNVIYQLKDGWYIFLSTIFMNLYRNSNVFILGFFISESLVGVYAGAEKVIKASQSVASPVSNAFFPYLAEDFKKGNLYRKIMKIEKISLAMAALLLVLSCCVYFFAPLIDRILLNGEKEGTIELIRLMTPVIFFGGLNYIVGIAGLINLGFQNCFFKYVMLSGLISIIFLFATVFIWGNYSAAFAMCISEIVLFLMCFYKLRMLKTA